VGFTRDVPNIKPLFPDRLPDAPEVLTPKFARIVSIVAAYDPVLELQFAEDIREDVNKIYEEVKSTGGRMSILGFRVPDDSADRAQTKFEDVKWNKASGLMSLSLVKGQVYPTILAAISQRLD
jgi:hypothetical protein